MAKNLFLQKPFSWTGPKQRCTLSSPFDDGVVCSPALDPSVGGVDFCRRSGSNSLHRFLFFFRACKPTKCFLFSENVKTTRKISDSKAERDEEVMDEREDSHADSHAPKVTPFFFIWRVSWRLVRGLAFAQ